VVNSPSIASAAAMIVVAKTSALPSVPLRPFPHSPRPDTGLQYQINDIITYSSHRLVDGVAHRMVGDQVARDLA
jgi:hypothetical protein